MPVQKRTIADDTLGTTDPPRRSGYTSPEDMKTAIKVFCFPEKISLHSRGGGAGSQRSNFARPLYGQTVELFPQGLPGAKDSPSI